MLSKTFSHIYYVAPFILCPKSSTALFLTSVNVQAILLFLTSESVFGVQTMTSH